jgi:hypothetical protein
MKALNRLFHIAIAVILTVSPVIGYALDKPVIPVRVVVEPDIGQARNIILDSGETVNLALLGIEETPDDVRNIIHEVKLHIKVDREERTGSSWLMNATGSICTAIWTVPIRRSNRATA